MRPACLSQRLGTMPAVMARQSDASRTSRHTHDRLAGAGLGEDFAGWVPALTKLSTTLGAGSFMRTLMRTINQVVRVDHCTVFIFRGREASGFLLGEDRMEPGLRRRLAEDYVGRYYSDDPNFKRVAGGPAAVDGVVLAFKPERLPERYREHFFSETGLVDKVSCFSWKGGRCVYSNFYRMRPSEPYSRRDRRLMRMVVPLLANLIAAHCQLMPQFARAGAVEGPLDPRDEIAMLETLTGSPLDSLSPRERDVCVRILLGYTSEAIGLHLGIATSTVLTLRKRAYDKLRITSQAELFSLYIQSLRRLTS
jgi:DNA-binding CsgD family transcriptional regulator